MIYKPKEEFSPSLKKKHYGYLDYIWSNIISQLHCSVKTAVKNQI